MAEQQQGPDSGYFRLFGQAASALGNLGLRLGAAGQSGGARTEDAWIESLLDRYRQIFGDLSDLVRNVLQRVGQVADVSSGHRLLFRAPPADGDLSEAERALHRFLKAIDALVSKQPPVHPHVRVQVIASKGLYKALRDDDGIRHAMDNWQVYGAMLDALLDDDRRRDLPYMLEKLRSEVRADRVQGFNLVRTSLAWLHGDQHNHAGEIYRVLDLLADVLGERCMREILRRRAVKAMLSLKGGSDGWIRDLKACFATFGFSLSDRIGVLSVGSPELPMLIVMDHEHDRWFEIRAAGRRKPRQPWPGCDVYGEQEGLAYEVNGKDIRLPLRVVDASQALAAWSVDKRVVQEALPKVPELDLRAWDTGANRTPVTLMFVHYKDGDLGQYYELGLGCFVAPRRDPLSVGVYMLESILVSVPRAVDVGEVIWGYEKEYVDPAHWTVHYRRDVLRCSVRLKGGTLHFEVPRGGGLSMPTAVPLLSYTRKPVRDPGPPAERFESGEWHRAVLTRFAQRDSVRSGAEGVKLNVEVHDAGKVWTHRLLHTLHTLGLVCTNGEPGAEPQHCVWTERMSAQLGPPVLVPVPGRDYD